MLTGLRTWLVGRRVPHGDWRLGVRGEVRTGPYAGWQVYLDNPGMTVADAIAVIVSPDLDVAPHPDERIFWPWPEQVSALVNPWNVVWSEQEDRATERRLGELA